MTHCETKSNGLFELQNTLKKMEKLGHLINYHGCPKMEEYGITVYVVTNLLKYLNI